MSYRDPLAQAHEKIARLEGELAAARAPRRASSAKPFFVVAVVLSVLTVLAATGVVLRHRRAPNTAIRVYNADDAIPFGKLVRVNGEMAADPAMRGPGTCELAFSIQRASRVIRVHLTSCSYPDPFPRAGMPATVDGTLSPDGHFEADSLSTKY